MVAAVAAISRQEWVFTLLLVRSANKRGLAGHVVSLCQLCSWLEAVVVTRLLHCAAIIEAVDGVLRVWLICEIGLHDVGLILRLLRIGVLWRWLGHWGHCEVGTGVNARIVERARSFVLRGSLDSPDFSRLLGQLTCPVVPIPRVVSQGNEVQMATVLSTGPLLQGRGTVPV